VRKVWQRSQICRLRLAELKAIDRFNWQNGSRKLKVGGSQSVKADCQIFPIIMVGKNPAIYLARHGETAWSLTGQHTGLTDLPLTAHGESNARNLGGRLRGLKFAKVFTSPLQRAARTCELAGFKSAAEVDRDLVEWNYGAYEGLRTDEILKTNPGWQLFRDGCPDGESPEQIGARADRVIRRVRSVPDDALIFSSGHFLRVFAARWLGLEPAAGKFFLLTTASLSALGYEHNLSQPVIQLWNDMRHVID
jgi:broad specificity phosphatase PhoE